MEDVIEKIAELTINGVEYILKLNANNEEMAIQLEQKNSGEIWNNSFTKDYVEDSTQKAGNFKKFNTFLKMLISAINKSSESVSLNILSYQDLEALKSRKNQNKQQSTSINASSVLAKKKFLILQYQVEYDKVQYPLSLDLNENPDPLTLKQIISRLRLENEVLRQGRSESSDQNLIIQLKHENQILRAKLFNKEEGPSLDRDHPQNLKLIEEQGEEIKYLKQILDNREREMLLLKSENAKLMEHAQNFVEMQDAISKIKEGERVMFQQQQRLEQMDLEMTSILQELETYKNNDKRQKQRIILLEQELEGTLNKITTTNRSRNDSKNKSISNLSSSINRGRSSSINKKVNNVIHASPLRNTSALLNSSGRQTPTNLSRSNSQSNLKKTPSRPTSSNQRQGSIGLNRRNSIESDTESSKYKKNINNMRTSSPSRSSLNLNSSQTKKSSNTPQKKTIVSNTKMTKSPQNSNRNSVTYGYPSKNNTIKSNTQSIKTQQTKAAQNKILQNNKDEGSDDEERLMKKLMELRKQNKENTESQNALKKSRLLDQMGNSTSSTSTLAMNKQNLGSTFTKENLQNSSVHENSPYTCDNTTDIDDRLHKLQNLLRIAKN
ncbi:variable flagellar number 3, putative (macronuclear) [Tetrahymena thermophila SB210]|uniref:Variable flagellar number 3, putative n=1 Tax=Tetrahymena thermophila (strain SB210) TaxID=312017 RepID=I7ME73_TETTS|nr:variable flagellar number 3, putative [Tetrahymena thermophila SB210]EAR95635.1 variable flagellar number 3, putative [Tetrahymena thermophila SB210]|eukprot:XP_001015880.1 variable flagellar number 3, putative [Tetrahymena thermophila SB210]